MVLTTGFEPAWYRYRGILSPLRLPISPHQHMTAVMRCFRILFVANKHGTADSAIQENICQSHHKAASGVQGGTRTLRKTVFETVAFADFATRTFA